MGSWGDGEMGRWGDGEMVIKHSITIQEWPFASTDGSGLFHLKCCNRKFVRGYLKSFLILNFAPRASQFWGEQESICLL
ncbi:MAG: hypothetical protein F6K54_27600 [Okeania sp. SIO3B5]|uniref:hypothetical protein n=1 Tax=Okeania sp. SIO3B5 TaxID=2607811 RepID=UPI0014002035|nr:hypothetical protein [Okeania sp. SIO3B5]NEO56513.1 hypothetical protein [Okeania sp. SIO3B5]